MIFDWYKIFNLTEFNALDLVSKTYSATLEDIGDEDFLVVKGNLTSVVYQDVMLPIQLNGENPVVREGDDDTYGVFLDVATQDVYVGIRTDDA